MFVRASRELCEFVQVLSPIVELFELVMLLARQGLWIGRRIAFQLIHKNHTRNTSRNPSLVFCSITNVWLALMRCLACALHCQPALASRSAHRSWFQGGSLEIYNHISRSASSAVVLAIASEEG